MDVSEIDRELCRQRPGHELGKRQAFFVLGFGDPSAPLDEVAVHVADESHRAAETDCAKLQGVTDECPQRISGSSLRLRGLDSSGIFVDRRQIFSPRKYVTTVTDFVRIATAANSAR